MEDIPPITHEQRSFRLSEVSIPNGLVSSGLPLKRATKNCRNSRTRTPLKYTSCVQCKNVFCQRCMSNYVLTKHEKVPKNFLCSCCQGKCCCLYEYCNKVHMHCYTYRRTERRHKNTSITPRPFRKKLVRDNDSSTEEEENSFGYSADSYSDAVEKELSDFNEMCSLKRKVDAIDKMNAFEENSIKRPKPNLTEGDLTQPPKIVNFFPLPSFGIAVHPPTNFPFDRSTYGAPSNFNGDYTLVCSDLTQSDHSYSCQVQPYHSPSQYHYQSFNNCQSSEERDFFQIKAQCAIKQGNEKIKSHKFPEAPPRMNLKLPVRKFTQKGNELSYATAKPVSRRKLLLENVEATDSQLNVSTSAPKSTQKVIQGIKNQFLSREISMARLHDHLNQVISSPTITPSNPDILEIAGSGCETRTYSTSPTKAKSQSTMTVENSCLVSEFTSKVIYCIEKSVTNDFQWKYGTSISRMVDYSRIGNWFLKSFSDSRRPKDFGPHSKVDPVLLAIVLESVDWPCCISENMERDPVLLDVAMSLNKLSSPKQGYSKFM